MSETEQSGFADRRHAVAAVVMAAGKSTRMRSRLPKPLHPICGLPMTSHVIRACREAGVVEIVVIVGHEAESVKAGIGSDVEYALQQNQRGTGDAVRSAESLLSDWPGMILVLAGDTPLLLQDTLQRLIERHRASDAVVTMVTAEIDDPSGYGRVVRNSSGAVTKLVEQKDASEAERSVKEWNPSIYAFSGPELWPALANLTTDNAQGEYYLPDTVNNFLTAGKRVETVFEVNTGTLVGVNNRVELAEVTGKLRRRILDALMLSGVTIVDPATTYVNVNVTIGQDTVIEPGSHLLNGTTVGEDCVIGPNARIERSTLGNGVRVVASFVNESVLEDGSKVGPFSNLRPGSHLGPRAKVGDFVEIKNAKLGAGVSASHLAYIGDAEIGDGTNVGAGAITCNYDGFDKHRTVIGRNVFVGSNATLIAPLTIGDGAFIAAGSAIPSGSILADAFVIARSQPTVKPGRAAEMRATLAARKARKG